MFDFRHFSSLIVDRGNLFRTSVDNGILGTERGYIV